MIVFTRILFVLVALIALPAQAEVRLGPSTEVHAVGVYEGATQTGDSIHGPEVAIRVDRPGQKIILLIGSYEAVRWRITTTDSTDLTKIIVHGSGAQRSEVWINGTQKGDVITSDLSYAYAPAGMDFRQIVASVPHLTGQPMLRSFVGAYAPPAEGFVIDGTALPIPQLQPDYLHAQLMNPAEIPAAFQGMLADLGQADTRAGLVQFTYEGFVLPDPSGAAPKTYPITLDVPTISHPVAAAQDPVTGKLYGVSLGGDGYLYACDPATGVWTVESSMSGADAGGMIFDADSGRIVIVVSGMIAPSGPALLFYGRDGKKSKTALDMVAFAGLTDIYDPGNRPAPGLLPVGIAKNKLLVITGAGMGGASRRADQKGSGLRAYMIDMTSGDVGLVAYDSVSAFEPEPW